MEKVRLRLLKYWKIYSPGDIVSVPAGVMPERMIANKTAELYIPRRIFKKKEKKHGSDSNL